MAAGDSLPDWNWYDPDECTARLDQVRADSAWAEKIEPVDGVPPFTREFLSSLGITGIEFAAFKTSHATGLGADFVPVKSGCAVTESGSIYRLDGEHYFLQLDIRERLPFETGCFDWVYAEHLVEHVPPQIGAEWLTEVHRTLAPGGLLRLTTPDLLKYASSYLAGGGFFDGHRDRLLDILAPAPRMPGRLAFMINQLFYFYGHRWIYDADELRFTLSQAGFDPAATRVCSFRKGARPDVAALDSAVRNDETLYMEAERLSRPLAAAPAG